MEHLLELAKRNQERAWEVIRQTDIINIWKSVGAEINLVGSLNMGLLMKHKDIDFHIYTSPFRISDSFQAMARLAENPLIKRIEYGNSLDTEEQCVEWHAWFQDPDNESTRRRPSPRSKRTSHRCSSPTTPTVRS